MPPALRAMFLVFMMTVLAGCASPRYQTAYRYEPPLDVAGRACLEKCEQKLAGCQQSCTAAYQVCLQRIEPQVDERYNEALNRYKLELDQYRWEWQRYQFYQSLNWGYGYWYGGPGFYYPWPGPFYFPPTPPTKPRREAVFNRLQKENCVMDCGCQSIYDACFLGCGGKRIPETRCIANCPEEK